MSETGTAQATDKKRLGRPPGRKYTIKRIVYLDKQTDQILLSLMKEDEGYSDALRNLLRAQAKTAG